MARILTACVATMLLLTAVGCSTVRKVTYPPDFVYLDRGDVKQAMTRLSVDIWRIEDILGNSETVLPHEQEEITSILEDMIDVAESLGSGAVESNHPFIDQNIDGFRDDVRAAITDAYRDPPAYYRAGTLSGRCLACHRLRP